MEEDFMKKRYFSDNERYADLINGFVFNGRQVVYADALEERDSQTGFFRKERRRKKRGGLRYRDLIRKAAIGINFAVVGIENQEEVHYLMPLRTMLYDAGEYEKQAAEIKKKVRKTKGISKAEFLSGFTKENRLLPCITIVIYYGEEWDAGKDLHSLIDFTDMPDILKRMVGNYSINLLDIRKWEDTSVFRTDLKQVFNFIRLSKDKKKLRELVESDSYYKAMNEDAYDVAVAYTKSEKLVDKRRFQKGGKVDMCQALAELREEGVMEGIQTGIQTAIKIMRDLNIPEKTIETKVQEQYCLSEEQMREYFENDK